MLEAAWLFTVIAVFSVAAALHASPEYRATNVLFPGAGMLIETAAILEHCSIRRRIMGALVNWVEPSRKVTEPVGAVDVPQGEPLTRA